MLKPLLSTFTDPFSQERNIWKVRPVADQRYCTTILPFLTIYWWLTFYIYIYIYSHIWESCRSLWHVGKPSTQTDQVLEVWRGRQQTLVDQTVEVGGHQYVRAGSFLFQPVFETGTQQWHTVHLAIRIHANILLYTEWMNARFINCRLKWLQTEYWVSTHRTCSLAKLIQDNQRSIGGWANC